MSVIDEEAYFMEDIIQRLVDVDKECTKRVEDAKAKKLAAKMDLKEKKQQFYDQLIKEQSTIIDDHKTKLLAANKEKEKEQAEQYQNTLDNLERIYKENKNVWVTQIVERCIR